MINHYKKKFKKFIYKYINTNITNDKQFKKINISQPYYLQKLKKIIKTYNKFK